MSEILVGASAINLAAFAAFGVDKSFGRNRARRIREADLFLLALMGGLVGAIVGMYAFRHKTLKPRFRIGLPIILLLQIFAVAYLLHTVVPTFA